MSQQKIGLATDLFGEAQIQIPAVAQPGDFVNGDERLALAKLVDLDQRPRQIE